jgi:hypothetical protein
VPALASSPRRPGQSVPQHSRHVAVTAASRQSNRSRCHVAVWRDQGIEWTALHRLPSLTPAGMQDSEESRLGMGGPRQSGNEMRERVTPARVVEKAPVCAPNQRSRLFTRPANRSQRSSHLYDTWPTEQWQSPARLKRCPCARLPPGPAITTYIESGNSAVSYRRPLSLFNGDEARFLAAAEHG